MRISDWSSDVCPSDLRRTSPRASRLLVRDPAGRRLWRLRRALSQGREPAPVREAGCFAHARRKFFELADVEGAARRKSRGARTAMIYPIALEAVDRKSTRLNSSH